MKDLENHQLVISVMITVSGKDHECSNLRVKVWWEVCWLRRARQHFTEDNQADTKWSKVKAPVLGQGHCHHLLCRSKGHNAISVIFSQKYTILSLSYQQTNPHRGHTTKWWPDFLENVKGKYDKEIVHRFGAQKSGYSSAQPWARKRKGKKRFFFCYKRHEWQNMNKLHIRKNSVLMWISWWELLDYSSVRKCPWILESKHWST